MSNLALAARALGLSGAGPAALAGTGATPTAAWHALTAALTDPTAPPLAGLAPLAALLAWAACLALAAAVTRELATSHQAVRRRGAAATAHRAALRALLGLPRLAPVHAGLALTVLLPVPAAAAVAAAPGQPDPHPRPGVALDLGWPGLRDATARDRVVAPGDTLWGLAAQHLQALQQLQTLDQLPAGDPASRPGAATPTDRQVALAWPAWWVANRDVLGDRPHLLRPGTALRAPALTPATDGLHPLTAAPADRPQEDPS